MNLDRDKAEEAYINVSTSSKKNFLLAFHYLLVEQKRFLNIDLTLENIASELHVSKGHLSRIINSHLGMSFNDYVNKLRVNEAKIYLNKMDLIAVDILNIALKSGFNSKSTFYASFKKLTGLTPYQFKNNGINESEMMT
ncbi:MAG: AraC family transcriptional regulator [Aquaticitalea sp.]